ncbi:MAG: TIGR00725 family protein [Thermodesulfobacteriota bacterium]
MKNIIGVIGTGNYELKQYRDAEITGKLIAERDCILVCGGLKGVMEAACKGAKSANGLTIGIVPSSEKSSANRYVDICIPSGMGEARNILIVNSSDAIIAIGGSFGTLSEISFALKSNIPVIGLNTWDVSEKIIKCENPKEAVNIAVDLAACNFMQHEKT